MDEVYLGVYEQLLYARKTKPVEGKPFGLKLLVACVKLFFHSFFSYSIILLFYFGVSQCLYEEDFLVKLGDMERSLSHIGKITPSKIVCELYCLSTCCNWMP